ncbi:MAG: hypothetical protein K2Y51_25265 [Gammaproteobacteria bacterium]|nr:hypothetical protein [Gammaproteobacteria bacterium]
MFGSSKVSFSARGMAVLLSCALLVGCASTPPAPVASAATTPSAAPAPVTAEDTEARAQRIFLYESRVADALLDRFPMRDDFVAAEPGLAAAEARMAEACGPLTRAVLRHLEGRKQSVKQKFKVANSLDACENAARQVEGLLAQHSDGLVATGN